MNHQILDADRKRIGDIADAMNEAIPAGMPSGYVMSALCLLLQIGLERSPEDVKEQARTTIVKMFSEMAQ
jgi:hypothetical protein